MAQSGSEGQEPTPPPSGSSGWGQGGGGETGAGAASGFQIKTVVAEKGPVPGVEYAELPMRIGAYIIDAVILAICYFIVASALIGFLVFSGMWYITWVIIAVLYAAGSAIYFIWSWTHLRASPGQKILNLETVNAGNGATIKTEQAVRRYLFLFGPMLLAQVFSFGGFGYVFIGWLVSLAAFAYAIWLLYTVSQSTKRQGFHDVQATTVVVRRAATKA
jgi:uncharacterized RDD family membrane protein YckC